MKRLVVVATGVAALGLSLAACGGDDDSASPGAGSNNGAAASNDEGNSGSSNQPSTLIVDGEALEVTSAGLCHLEPQDSAGGGGQILATARISATNTDGQDVHLDFTRYDADSQFHGDDLSFTIGITGDDGWMTGSFEEGTVSVADGIVSAEGLDVYDNAAGMAAELSFEIVC